MQKLCVLVFLLVALVAYLGWRRTPRPILFEALLNSAWIYTGSFFLTVYLTDKFSPHLLDGICPYLLPVIPTALFLSWFLPWAKVVDR